MAKEKHHKIWFIKILGIIAIKTAIVSQKDRLCMSIKVQTFPRAFHGELKGNILMLTILQKSEILESLEAMATLQY